MHIPHLLRRLSSPSPDAKPSHFSFLSYAYDGKSVCPVCLSVRPSVHHTPVLCQNEETQLDAVFTVG